MKAERQAGMLPIPHNEMCFTCLFAIFIHSTASMVTGEILEVHTDVETSVQMLGKNNKVANATSQKKEKKTWQKQAKKTQKHINENI